MSSSDNHHPIREDVGGYFCGTCGLSVDEDRPCAGPPPSPLAISRYELTRIKEALQKSGRDETHTLALIDHHLTWNGCWFRIGYHSHAFFSEALHDIQEHLLEHYNIPKIDFSEWEASPPWSGKLFFKDAEKKHPRDLHFILHNEKASLWREKETGEYLSKVLSDKLLFPVEVVVLYKRKTRGLAMVHTEQSKSTS